MTTQLQHQHRTTAAREDSQKNANHGDLQAPTMSVLKKGDIDPPEYTNTSEPNVRSNSSAIGGTPFRIRGLQSLKCLEPELEHNRAVSPSSPSLTDIGPDTIQSLVGDIAVEGPQPSDPFRASKLVAVAARSRP